MRVSVFVHVVPCLCPRLPVNMFLHVKRLTFENMNILGLLLRQMRWSAWGGGQSSEEEKRREEEKKNRSRDGFHSIRQ